MKNIFILFLTLFLPLLGFSQAGNILSSKTINTSTDNWIVSNNLRNFGKSMAAIGDIDGNGTQDLAVGCSKIGISGGVAILFLEADGSVKKHSYIGEGEGGLEYNINRGSLSKFGTSITNLGDLDGDGITDIAVGSYDNYKGGNVYILFLNKEGTIKSQSVIESRLNNFTPYFTGDDHFGYSLATLEDLDNDGNPELLVGNPRDEINGERLGAAYILFLSNDGKVKKYTKISENIGGFTDSLENSGYFGFSVAKISNNKIAIGSLEGIAPKFAGKFWLVDINASGIVTSQYEVSERTNGFNDTLTKFAVFGGALCGVGDIDGDAVPDLAVGSFGYNDIHDGSGAVFIFLLNSDGTIKSHIRHSNSTQSLSDSLGRMYAFGSSITSLGDFNGDGKYDIAVGVPGDLIKGTNTDKGRVDLLFLDGSSHAAVDMVDIPVPTIYPNPASSIVHFKDIQNIKSITITNGIGEVVLEKAGDNLTSLETNTLPSGVYFVAVTSIRGLHQLKLLIE
jgi:hypothetical protein